MSCAIRPARKGNRSFRVLLFVSAVLLLLPQARGQDYPSTGVSHNLVLRYSLDESYYLSSINNFATSKGQDDFTVAYLDLTFGRKFGTEWAVDAGYRRVWIQLGDQENEHRPLVNLKYTTFPGGWFLLNRSRLEWRLFENPEVQDRVRFRHQVLAVSPWEVPVVSAKWFIEEEFFAETEGRGLNLNWLTTGLRWPLDEGVSFKLGYRLQSQKFGEWEHRHVLVTGLNVFF